MPCRSSGGQRCLRWPAVESLQTGTELVQPKVIRIILPPKTPLQLGAVRQVTESVQCELLPHFEVWIAGGSALLGSDAISIHAWPHSGHGSLRRDGHDLLHSAPSGFGPREKIPGTEFPAVATKTACDFACCASIFNSAYLGLVPCSRRGIRAFLSPRLSRSGAGRLRAFRWRSTRGLHILAVQPNELRFGRS